MKNIHLIPTEKPSRLYKTRNKFYLEPYPDKSVIAGNQNIYITSDEEIKEGDWFIRDGSIHKCFRVHKTDIEFLTSIDSIYCGSNTFWNKEFCKKIILTTDQDLIKDSVQAIDDEFLEWFVKNPSCDEVEVGYGWIRLTETDNEGYWVSIPDKQFEMQQEEPKQEKLEEAAEKYANDWEEIYPELDSEDITPIAVSKIDFIAGAKWQAERSYSEEDMQQYAEFCIRCYQKELPCIIAKDWFKLYKNK